MRILNGVLFGVGAADIVDGRCIIPDSVTSIKDWAFYSCTGLTSVAIPDSVTSIGGSAFRECTGLTNVVIPETVTSMGDWAFAYCTGLTGVALARHTAFNVCGDWWQIGCRCRRLDWWTGAEGRVYSKKNGYTDAEIEEAILLMTGKKKGAAE